VTGSDPRASARFDFVTDWQSPDAANAEAISTFWRSEGAFTEAAQMKARLPQVVMHACTSEGEVAGVCTAIAMTPPQLAQPVYYWRTFVGARWRSTPLVMMLLKRSCTLLEEHARTHDYPCIGIMLELENDRFRDKGRMAVWWNPRFAYIGRSPRGLDVRMFYFKGAKLKPAKNRK
jgi:hypothetical protein